MYCIPTEPNEIYRIIVNLKNNKSPGADNIGSKILKEVVDDITYPLSHIFNLSFVTGVVPHSTDSPDCLPILLSISVFSLYSSCSPLLVFRAVD